jgi:hypothetical protein
MKKHRAYVHVTLKPERCHDNPPTYKHEFTGWRIHHDGRGGEQVCKHCGMGAMEYSLRTGP